jgi:copper oxidase (laccase) domain-containing protein
MQEKFSSRAEQLPVAVGPGIGECCYEVGPEVAAQFRQYDSVQNDPDQPVHLDLAAINRRQLEQAGVPPEQIYLAGLCTMCNAEFHSFRRERTHAGRMLSWAGIR